MKLVQSLILVSVLIVSCQETSTVSPTEDTSVIFVPDTTDSSDTSDSSDTADSSDTPDSNNTDSGKIFIKDRTGKKWDITHAVNKYGFEPNKFQFGLGPFAIRPILNPEFLSPVDQNYPSNSANDLVIGTVINEITRAYPLSILVSHEVANDDFDRTYVAVAY
jgi:hypothetical protein